MIVTSYAKLALFFFFGLAISLIPLLINALLAPSKPSDAKHSPYECGFEPFSDSRFKFDIRFYLVAILFIIFDLEMAFLFPWSILVKNNLGPEGFVAMLIFLVLLIAGFIYEWNKGALEWE